jgi:hypothetical protein
MGSGFYLRKALDGSWVLLLGAAKERTVSAPPYALWTLLDTMHLAALDFDPNVADALRAIMCFARVPELTHALDEANFKKLLYDLRALSVRATGAQSTPEDAREYLMYLLRESLVCRHILNVMESIGKNTHYGHTLKDALQLERLEEDLQVSVFVYYVCVCVYACTYVCELSTYAQGYYAALQARGGPVSSCVCACVCLQIY